MIMGDHSLQPSYVMVRPVGVTGYLLVRSVGRMYILYAPEICCPQPPTIRSADMIDVHMLAVFCVQPLSLVQATCRTRDIMRSSHVAIMPAGFATLRLAALTPLHVIIQTPNLEPSSFS